MAVLPQAARRPAARAAPSPFKTTLTSAQMTGKEAVLETSMGTVVIDLRPDLAPNHVGYMMKLAGEGAYNGTAFHRVVRGFAAQTGALTSRGAPLTERQQKLVHRLQPEFNDITHVKGVASMARGEDPASATTSFFIVTGPLPSLDGKYTAFGRVVDGMEAVDRIDAAPVNGEAPVTRIDLIRVRIIN